MTNAEKVNVGAAEKVRELAEFQEALKTPQGRAVMEHLRRISGADKSSFRPGDACGTAFACGLRDAELDVAALAEKYKLNERTKE